MYGIRTAVIATLVSVIALAACDQSAAGPADESSAAAFQAQRSAQELEQAPTVPGPPGPQRILELSEELDLREDQRSEIAAIAERLHDENESLWTEVRGARPGESGPPSEGPGRRASLDDPSMQSIRANMRSAMQAALAVLDQEQARRFLELRHDRDGPALLTRPAPPRGSDPGDAVLAVFDELTLSDAQAAEITALFEEVRTRNRALIEELRDRPGPGGSPGPDARHDPDDPVTAQLRQNLRETMEAVQEILTDEQWMRMRSLLDERLGPPPGDASP